MDCQHLPSVKFSLKPVSRGREEVFCWTDRGAGLETSVPLFAWLNLLILSLTDSLSVAESVTTPSSWTAGFVRNSKSDTSELCESVTSVSGVDDDGDFIAAGDVHSEAALSKAIVVMWKWGRRKQKLHAMQHMKLSK